MDSDESYSIRGLNANIYQTFIYYSDSWIGLDTFFKEEEEYDPDFTFSDKIEDDNIVVFSTFGNENTPFTIARFKIKCNGRIFEFESAIEWKKREKKDKKSPRIQFPKKITLKKRKISCYIIGPDEEYLRFLEVFRDDIEIKPCSDILEIQKIKSSFPELVLINYEIFKDVKKYCKFFKKEDIFIIRRGEKGEKSDNTIFEEFFIDRNYSVGFFKNLCDRFLKRIMDIDSISDILKFWEKNSENKELVEKNWQLFLNKHPKIFSVALENMEHVSGNKKIGELNYFGTGIKELDFLYMGDKGNAIIIEIKRPTTKLVYEKKFSNLVYTPSRELTSSIVQVSIYKDLYQESINKWKEILELIGLKKNVSKCYIIIGNKNILNNR